jgi:lipopolysaccharide biosynthesis glycosyltransferase
MSVIRGLLLAPILVGQSIFNADLQKSDSQDIVQVAVAVDKGNMHIVRALLNSAIVNSPTAFVHVIHAQDGSSACQDLVKPDFVQVASCVLWEEEKIAQVSSLIRVVSGQNSSACEGLEGCDLSRAKRLANSFNFARFFLADILPDLDYVFWMDCDVVIRNSISQIWTHSKQSSALVSAFPEPVRFGRFYLQEDSLMQLMRNQFVGLNMSMDADSFNDGVIFINLKQWRQRDVKRDLIWLMTQHSRSETGLWKYGTQPIMMLLGSVHGWSRLKPEHCYGDLGFMTAEPKRTEEAVFLHFNGELKPWKASGINKHLWEPHYYRREI